MSYAESAHCRSTSRVVVPIRCLLRAFFLQVRALHRTSTFLASGLFRSISGNQSVKLPVLHSRGSARSMEPFPP